MFELKLNKHEKEIEFDLIKKIHERLIWCVDSDNMEKAFNLKKLLNYKGLLDSTKIPEQTSKNTEDVDVKTIKNKDHIKIKSRESTS